MIGRKSAIPTILMSLKPEYWDSVLSKEKSFEYRRSFRKEACNAFIYVTMPVGAIMGLIFFDTPVITSTNNICNLAEKESPGCTPGMRLYMKGLDSAFAIPILDYEEIEPMSLNELRTVLGKFTPPQSYILLDKQPKILELLEKRRKKYERFNI